jgi:hypothetical protein
MEESIWIRGLFNGHDYMMTRDQFLDVKLVSSGTKILIVVIPVLVFLFTSGIYGGLGFFVPAVVYPPVIELISRFKRRTLVRPHQISEKNLARKINWDLIDKIEFDGGFFSVSIKGNRHKFTGFTKNSNVNSMVEYIRAATKVKDIKIRKVDWTYLYSSFLLATFAFFILPFTMFWVPSLLATSSVIALLIFIIKLVSGQMTTDMRGPTDIPQTVFKSKSGFRAGIIAGLMWATLMVVVGLFYLQLSYSEIMAYYNGLLVIDPNALSGMTAPQYIIYRFKFSAIISYVIGVGFGALSGLILPRISSNFPRKPSSTKTGIIVAVIAWVIYDLAFIPYFAIWLVLSSLAVSLISGFTGGALYSRFCSPNIRK